MMCTITAHLQRLRVVSLLSLLPVYPEVAWNTSCCPPRSYQGHHHGSAIVRCPCMVGLCECHESIDRFVQRTVKIGHLPHGVQPKAETLVMDAENRLLSAVNQCHYHVCMPRFPPVITRRPGLRPCPHDFSLPHKDNQNYNISNLPFLSKLLERVISVQLTDYLSSAGLLPVHQSAYRKFHSTETALLKVVTDLIEAIDAGDHALLGLLDLS